jgi:ribonuclease G
LRREILVSASPQESWVALLEDGQLVEVLFDRPDQGRLIGDIYLGRVDAVIPGIQAAFVDIGAEKAGFLHVSDLDYGDEEDEDENGNGNGGGRRRKRDYPPIQQQVQKGQQILVQVTKEPISTKGPGSRPRCHSRVGSWSTSRGPRTSASAARSRTVGSGAGSGP